MNEPTSIHPEVLPDVLAEYKRLTEKAPEANKGFLWDRAVWYVRALAQANTELFIHEYMNVSF